MGVWPRGEGQHRGPSRTSSRVLRHRLPRRSAGGNLGRHRTAGGPTRTASRSRAVLARICRCGTTRSWPHRRSAHGGLRSRLLRPGCRCTATLVAGSTILLLAAIAAVVFRRRDVAHERGEQSQNNRPAGPGPLACWRRLWTLPSASGLLQPGKYRPPARPGTGTPSGGGQWRRWPCGSYSGCWSWARSWS